MKSIFEFESFSAYIQELFAEEKRFGKQVTHGAYAKKFGISGSALNLILARKRNLTVTNLNRIAHVLRLPRAEREFFEALVLRDQAEDRETRGYYASKLRMFRAQRQTRHLRVGDKQLLSNWLVPSLLIYLIDFEKVRMFEEIDFERVAARFGMATQEVERLVTLFEKHGLLAADSKGLHIVFDRVTFQVPQKDYVRAVTAEMSRRLDKEFENILSIFRAAVFSIDREKIPEFHEELVRLIDKYITELSENDENRVLYQGVFGFFPIFGSV